MLFFKNMIPSLETFYRDKLYLRTYKLNTLNPEREYNGSYFKVHSP